MEIDKDHTVRRAHFRVDHGAQRPVRPDGFEPAELHTVWMRVLAGAQRMLHRAGAMQVRIGFHRGAARRHRFRRQVGRVDDAGQFLIAGVFGMRFRVVEEVAVEVDIVLVDAPVPGEAVRVDRVNEQDGRVVGKIAAKAFRQQRCLDARAAIALDAVRSRADGQNAGCVRGSEPRHIHRQRFAGRPLQRMQMMVNARARILRRCKETVPRFCIALGKMRCCCGHF